MKVAAIGPLPSELGDRKAGTVERPDPIVAGPFALVKVRVAPMCTEYKAFKNGATGDRFGHEAAGEVVETPAYNGDSLHPRVQVGDRVVVQPQYACGRCELCQRGENIHCQHQIDVKAVTGSTTGTATYAQYLLKQDWLLSPIPDSMSFERASMACCGLGPTFGAMEQMQVDAFDTVLITGMGPVGLGGVINARYRGARVIAVESHPYRANLARELGAEAVIDPGDETALAQIMEMTKGIGVDKAIDCAGPPAAQRLLIDAARRKGQVTFVAEAGELTIKVGPDMLRKGLVLRGNWHYNLIAYPKLMKVVQALGEQLDKLITHTFPMSQVQQAWELQITGNCGKVLLDPWA